MHLEQKTQQDISLSAVPDVRDGKGRELAKDHEGRSWGRNGRNGMESRKSPAGGHGLSAHLSPQMEGTNAAAGVQASNQQAPFHLKSQGSNIQTGRGGPGA